MRRTLGAIALAGTMAACSPRDVISSDRNENSAAQEAPLTLSPLELQARRTITDEASARAKQKKLEEAARAVMEDYLFDPASAKYTGLRGGRGAAICGKYNAKNRYGAYVGFKDFVISGDRKSLVTSERNDGIESEWYTSFAQAYLESCATEEQRKAHARITSSELDTTMNVDENLTVSDDPFAEE